MPYFLTSLLLFLHLCTDRMGGVGEGEIYSTKEPKLRFHRHSSFLFRLSVFLMWRRYFLPSRHPNPWFLPTNQWTMKETNFRDTILVIKKKISCTPVPIIILPNCTVSFSAKKSGRRDGMDKLGRWVGGYYWLSQGDGMDKLGRCVTKSGRWVAKLGKWVAKLVARLLATAALHGFEIRI